MNQGIKARPVPSPAPRPDSALLKYLPGGGAMGEEEGEYAVPVQVDFGRPKRPNSPLPIMRIAIHYAHVVCIMQYFREHIQHLHYIYQNWCKQTDQNFYQLYFLFLPVLYRDHLLVHNSEIHAFIKDSIPLSLSLSVFLFSILKVHKHEIILNFFFT
jgi:hypothetical protein